MIITQNDPATNGLFFVNEIQSQDSDLGSAADAPDYLRRHSWNKRLEDFTKERRPGANPMYDFWIYYYNASAVVGKSVFKARKKKLF
jgi:hypothetical protein